MIAAPEVLQREEELPALLALYRERAPRRVLEIGTLYGGTLFHWLREAPVGAKVVAVDTQDHVSGALEQWTPDGVEAILIVGDSASREVVEKVGSYGPYDWVFIDAGHYLYEVRADWENYSPLCVKGGVVVLHDVSHDSEYPHIQVWQLWEEIIQSHKTDLIGIDTGIVYL